ncbi:MAG TPA: hypothetical protein DEP35_16575, partial [Deltaproteobacteria bacterium]|nr:hypothetical protein [Deltaproteobacteria bacterium]
MSSRLHRLFRSTWPSLVAAALAAGGASKVLAGPQETGTLGPPFKEGDVITFEKIDLIRPYL